MPSRAKMMRKRKSSSRREQMAFMEFSSELTRSDKAAQCLQTPATKGGKDDGKAAQLVTLKVLQVTFFFSLKSLILMWMSLGCIH